MKERLTYIDLFRGLCIFAVVYGHVINFCTTSQYHSIVYNFLTSFFLVGFFFISGLLSYREEMLGCFEDLCSFVKKKIMTLLVPSVVMMTLYAFIVTKDIFYLLHQWNLWASWFTYVLFIVNVVFGISLFFLRKLNNKYLVTLVFFAMCVLSYILSKVGVPKTKLVSSLQLIAVVYYLPFFLLGVIAKMYYRIFDRITNNKLFFIFVFLVMIITFNVQFVPLLVKSVSALLFVYCMCKKLVETENKPKGIIMMEKILTFFGKNSLEIYFVHFVLLFRLPTGFENYYDSLYSDTCMWGHSCAGFVELLVVGALSIVIVYASVLFAYILKLIPYMSLLLFGKNRT